MNTEIQKKHLKKSKLDQFELGFEYNRTLSDERKIIRLRNNKQV